MRRMETSCDPTSRMKAHSRTEGFHAQAVALNCRFMFERLGQTQLFLLFKHILFSSRK